jgi:hypothetical protein
MSNTKQTAVEQFAIALYEGGYLQGNGDEIQKLLEQAKEMEKEQIVNTWSEATAPQHEIGLSDASYVIDQIKKAEQYYEQTYGGGNK